MRCPAIAHRLLLTLALGLAVSPHLSAQGSAHPDLSGTWIFNAAKSEPAARLANRTETIAITCTNDTIELQYSANGKDSTQAFIIDAKEHVGKQAGAYTKAAWKGSELQTEIRATLSDGTTLFDLKTHWSVSKDGRVLKRVEDGPARRVLVYDKQ